MTSHLAARRIVHAGSLVWVALFTVSGCVFRHGVGEGADGGLASVDVPNYTDVTLISGDATGGGDGGTCLQVLRAVVRDFRGFPGPNNEPKHPDFEYQVGDVRGLVQTMLGADDKPVYAPPGPTAITNGPDAFAQWYRDVDGVNLRFEIQIPLSPAAGRAGTFVYDNDAFFPIDTMGYGNQNQVHNFHFTTELHFNFPYRGGEVFTFRGDDDVWIFVNGRLALDLGGVHNAETGTVDLDRQAAALGITPNNSYRMDVFHAERHTSASTFHVETTLQCIDNVVIP